MKKSSIGFYIGIVLLSIALIVVLATGFWERFIPQKETEEHRSRIITPLEAGSYSIMEIENSNAWDENLSTKIPMEEGESVIAVLNKESEEGLAEEQFAVYRRGDAGSPIHITFLSIDENTRIYRRMWDVPIAATRAETISIYSQDLIGDRNNCIIVTGMNSRNEHTMTIFRRAQGQPARQAYTRIAELQISGSIVIQETTRSQAYLQGITRGASYNIASYSHDTSSANILDQIETIYSFNSSSQRYEQIRVSRVPGSQIEQRRLRELLSGAPGVFENFINDLWYFVSPHGTINSRQYIYFDPSGREVIFYGDDAQQVFRWQNSTPTRYGVYIRSQNISISTLLRFIDIELESLDSIRMRVIEDVRLRITASTAWDGTYRRAGIAEPREAASVLSPAVDALFDSSWGRLTFNKSGEYSITAGANTRRGRYIFFSVENYDLLELRPTDGNEENRMIYRVESGAGVQILNRIRLSVTGILDLPDPPITLTPVN